MTTKGIVVGINGNMVTAKFDKSIRMNEVGYIELTNKDSIGRIEQLKAEIIRIHGNECDMQVFEDTKGISINDSIVFSENLLSIELGPGLLSNVYDGLGNPLKKLSEKVGYFLQRGIYLNTLDREKKWNFSPNVKIGDKLKAANTLGIVPEGVFTHRIMIPFNIIGEIQVESIANSGYYNVNKVIAKIKILNTNKIINIKMFQKWPIKKAIKSYNKRLLPQKPLTTSVRIVDSLFPIAEGGTACIPGPFGSGKTVFQQSVSRYGDADIVILAACGERAGEVVETLREFPELNDPRTGRSLMERTIIICNTSSMPVAAREASVYTAITIAEYYRQMGLRVLVLADSTSRWAQALREMSGRLEEIPGEEAFPAYLGSLIAAFYERAGIVELHDPNLGKCIGSTTLIGTVSPAGGNFEEPVTQSTLAVVGCFLGLTYARSYAKRFPAISPMESWSKYLETMKDSLEKIYCKGWVDDIKWMRQYYEQGQKIGDQMKVVGEEDLSMEEFVHFHKSEFFDAVFLQQNAFDEVDASPSTNRVCNSLKLTKKIVTQTFDFKNKVDARNTLQKLTTLCRELNLTKTNNSEFKVLIEEINKLLQSKKLENKA